MMTIYYIQIDPLLHQKLELATLTYLRKQEAIDALTEAFQKHDVKFSVKKEGLKTSFLNEHGGKLAAIVSV